MMPSSAETAPSGEMRALRWWAAGDVRLDVVPVPTELPDGWVLVAVEACGICGTDLEEFLSGPVVIPTDDHPLTGAKVPLTLGHEVVGRIVASKAAQSPPVGSRVVVEGNRFCGECFWCRRREFPLCPMLGSLGQMDNGGLADFMRAPGYMCLPLEDAIPSVEAVLVEPLSVVLRALRRKGDVEDANLVIFGGGTLGLLAIQAARALGAAEVVLVEPNEGRRELALDLGASLFLHPDETSSLAERYEAGGPDVALECAGSPAAVVAAVETIRPGGTAILLGVHDGPFEIDMLPFLLQEKTLTASVSHVWDEDFPQALDLLHRGLIRTAPLITSVVPLDRTVADGFVALADHGDEHIKIAIVPSLSDPETLADPETTLPELVERAQTAPENQGCPPVKDFDLRTAEAPEVIGYLRSRGLDVAEGAEVVPLTGGVSGSVVRVETADGRVVCKQALAQLAVPGRWEADRRRTLTEARALEVLGTITPAAVPRMIDVDPDTLTLTMACAPDGWDCWKDRLLAGEMPARSVDIARTLGECLAAWHRSTADNPILEVFDDHETFRLLRTDPFYRSLGDVHPEIAERVSELAKDLHERRSCLVHGDFSPKNVLSGTNGLWVVDHEVAVAAHPVFDLAFLMSHLVLKAVAPERRHLLEAAGAFLDAYRADWPDCEVQDEEIADHVAVLMLARVDGVSQVHYLSPSQRGQVRQLSVRRLTGGAVGLKDLFDEVRAFGPPEEMSRR